MKPLGFGLNIINKNMGPNPDLLVVSTQLENVSKHGNLPQGLGKKCKKSLSFVLREREREFLLHLSKWPKACCNVIYIEITANNCRFIKKYPVHLLLGNDPLKNVSHFMTPCNFPPMFFTKMSGISRSTQPYDGLWYSEDHARLVSLPNGWTPWLINGGDHDPNPVITVLGWSSKYQLQVVILQLHF